jgi:hypothetical protein
LKNQNHTQADCEQLIHAGQRIGATFGVVLDFNCVQIELIQKYSRTKKRGTKKLAVPPPTKSSSENRGIKRGTPRKYDWKLLIFSANESLGAANTAAGSLSEKTRPNHKGLMSDREEFAPA